MQNYLRAFIAGMALPSFLLPILLFMVGSFGTMQMPYEPYMHIIPLVWGIWNVLYFSFFKDMLPFDAIIRYAITGALLGLFIAVLGVFVLDIPHLIGIPAEYNYFPLVIGPLLYAVLWAFIVRPLNMLIVQEE